MIIDIDGLEIDLDKLFDAFTRLFAEMGLDESDDYQVYNTITVFIASLIASSLQEDHGDNPAELEARLQATCSVVAEDLEEKVRAFFQ